MIDRIFKKPDTRFAMVFQMACIALAGFIVLRIVLCLRYWHVLDHNLMQFVYIFGQGLIYDIGFLGYFCIPFVVVLLALPDKWLHSRIFKIIAQITQFTVLYVFGFGLVAEWFFWEEFKSRFNFISVDYLVYRREVTDNIIQTYPVFWILPIIFVITMIVFLILRPYLIRALDVKESFSKRCVIAGCILVIPLAGFLFLNQSQRRLSDNNYVNELASNGPYQLFAAFRNNTLDYHQFYVTMDDKMLSKVLKSQVCPENCHYLHDGLYNIARHVTSGKPAKKLNVILVSVESLSAKFLTRFGEKRNLTPFMDRWFRQGLLFTNFYATGTRTVRGLEAITLSIPPTPGRSIIKRPDNANLYSLGRVFGDYGYDCAFLYGGRGYFDNMNAFFSSNGYRIVDETDFTKDEITFKNAWGVSDEDLFNKTIREANRVYRSGKPFFFHIMTTTNHQPFTFPRGRIDLEPGEGGSGSGRAGGVKFTDYAFSQLVSKAKKQPWFDDTVFVVVADHCAASAGKIGLPLKKYHIPLFIYAPKYIAPGEIAVRSSQIDIAPTLLALLDFSYDSFFFGRNILAPDFTGRALVANYQKLGLWISNELLILSPVKRLNLVDTSAEQPSLEKIAPSFPFVKELIAYYQGADYVFRNRLNRLPGAAH
jgi:phosphoglycerol transferase MdoB-like AlkP superfamily enzyme